MKKCIAYFVHLEAVEFLHCIFFPGFSLKVSYFTCIWGSK
uniref:Uncharacterized protein n=1 Tax=Rhizophora mucronata TaxID=61149 RepID=A0A2P2NJN5_RHIMU